MHAAQNVLHDSIVGRYHTNILTVYIAPKEQTYWVACPKEKTCRTRARLKHAPGKGPQRGPTLLVKGLSVARLVLRTRAATVGRARFWLESVAYRLD